MWLKENQAQLTASKNYEQWKRQFQLFVDEEGMVRCGGRLGNSELPFNTTFPVMLDPSHHLTTLIVWNCHEKTCHGGVKSTLAQLRSRFWLIKGRQTVKKIIHKCIICKRFGGHPYKAPQPPPLPEFRVKEAPPFSYCGLDYLGPLHVKGGGKVWISLHTCCVTRGVHLEIVPDLSAEAFLRCFRRFTARRAVPKIVVSDNAKTFKPASRTLVALSKDPVVKKYFSQERIQWFYNLERAPWWGGFFERLVGLLKGSLKKTLGQAKLTLDELTTVVVEIEMIMNSRPLTYTSTDDLEEPLTPSHLFMGRRILSLPEGSVDDEIDDNDYHVSQDDLNKRLQYLSRVMNHFWRRWRSEYLVELRNEHGRVNKQHGTESVCAGDIVIVHDKDHPRGFWKLGKVESLITGHDGLSRGVVVRSLTRKGKPNKLRRPVQLLYPLELSCNDPVSSVSNRCHVPDKRPTEQPENPKHQRPRREAAVQGETRRRQWIAEMNYLS